MKTLIVTLTIVLTALLVTPAYAGVGVLVDEWVEGNNRFCKYDLGTGEFRISVIQAVAMCPMSYED